MTLSLLQVEPARPMVHLLQPIRAKQGTVLAMAAKGRAVFACQRHSGGGGTALAAVAARTRSVWSTEALSLMFTTCWGLSTAASLVVVSRPRAWASASTDVGILPPF
jgi:hypothetical protein